jgi:hypothetical protein
MSKEFKINLIQFDGEGYSDDVWLPMTHAEYQDLLDQCRIFDDTMRFSYEITEVTRSSLRHHVGEGKDNITTNDRSLLELNLLAQRLDIMDAHDSSLFDAMVKAETIRIGKDEVIPTEQLINMTFNTDRVITMAGIYSDKDLGEFLFENEMLLCKDHDYVLKRQKSGQSTDGLLSLLGKEHREQNNGHYSKNGLYAEFDGTLEEAYKPGEMVYFDRSGKPVILEISHALSQATALLELPATDIAVADALKAVGADSFDECEWKCTDCLIPFAKEWIDNAPMDDVSQFANFLYELERNDYPNTYKALLIATDCDNLQTALRLGEHLDEHTLNSLNITYDEYGRNTLTDLCGEEIAEKLLPYMNCEKFGWQSMLDDNIAETRYGLIKRIDGEPFFSETEDIAEEQDEGGLTLQ